MPALNTCVAKVQGTGTSDVCTATASLLTGSGGNGRLPPQTAFVLVFEMGQYRSFETDPIFASKKPVDRSILAIVKTVAVIIGVNQSSNNPMA